MNSHEKQFSINDLALTAEDVRKLIEIWMNLPDFPARSLSQIAEETLDIFNEKRQKV